MPILEVSAEERATYPFTAVGAIFSTFPDGTYFVGTASVVGQNDILTAGHNIYRPQNGGYATKLEFAFGADFNGVSQSYDSFDHVFFAPDNWQFLAFPSEMHQDLSYDLFTKSEAQYDIALIGVDTQIGNKTGSFGLQPAADSAQSFRQVGYPTGSTGMMTSVLVATPDSQYYVYESSTDVMGVGSSGGPLIDSENYIVGVKSFTYYDPIRSPILGTNIGVWGDIGGVYDKLIDSYNANDVLLEGETVSSTSTKGPTEAAKVFVFKSSKKGEGINPASEAYYYTSSEEEAEFILSQEKWPWIEQESTFEAAHSNPDEFIPVHKFWSDKHQSHYFTISEAEKDQIIDWSETGKNGYDWKYEGTGFNVYGSAAPTDSDGNPAIPVYKVWIDDKDFDSSNGVSGGHYFTADIEDYNTKIDLVGVKGEGVAFYGELLG